MKNKTLIGGLVAALLAGAACSSPAPANKTANTTSTTTTTTNTANRTTPPASNTTSTTNTTNTSASDSSSNSNSTEGKQDFTVKNATGVEIDKLYVSAHDKEDWEEDVLGQDTLPNGQSVDITFSPKEKAAMWDLKVVDKEGTSIEWENLNLMEISEVTLRFENGRATAETK